MFAVSLYTIFMGGYYDELIAKHLPGDADLGTYGAAPGGSPMATALNDAKNLAGPEVLQTTLFIPIFLVLAFGGLVFYMRSRKNVIA